MQAGFRTKIACAASAGLAGFAGLGIEAVLLSCGGLALGYGRSSALGLGAWVAAWALGAYVAGRTRRSPGGVLLAAGLASALLGSLALEALLGLGRTSPGGALATWLGMLAIGLAAFPQGFFLPLLARAYDSRHGGAQDVALLFASNLVGSVLGARFVGYDLAGFFGRRPAIWIAGGVACCAGLLIWKLARTERVDRADDGGPTREDSGALSMRSAGVVVGLVTAWLVGVEWIGLRLGVLWLGGMQPALTAVLGAALVALAAGAAVLPPVLPRGAKGVAWGLGIALLGGLWPFAAAGAIEAFEEQGRFVRALVLVGPALFPFGALVPLVHRAIRGESGERLGRLLVHEAWGGLLGVPLVHFILVPRFGLGGALAGLLLAGGAAGLALGAAAPRARFVLPLLALALGAVAFRAEEPALATPQLSNPAFDILSFTEDEDFAVTVVDDGVLGERTLLTDDFRATGTGDDYLYMRVLGHLPLLLHAAPKRVGVLAFGTGTTAGAVSLHGEVERIEVLELSRAVTERAAFFQEVNHGVLADEQRVRLHLGDGRRTLASLPGAFDVLTMEPLLPDSPFAVYLYTAEFYARARTSLAPGGLLCQWVPPHALEPATFDAVVDAFTRAFEWSGVFLFGTQVILVGGESLPLLDPRRFPAADAGKETGEEAGIEIGEEDALRPALAALGLDSPAGVLARFVTDGASWPRVTRALTDADPWVLYRHGALTPVLARLPRNFALLRERETDPPPVWQVAAALEAWPRLECARALHRAVEAWHVERGIRMGAIRPSDVTLGSPEDYLAIARNAAPGDPELQAFERLARFEETREAGFVALHSDRDPRTAYALLLEAATLRPKRADVHFFVAIAAERMGETGVAQAAAKKAAELCPRLLETPQGRAGIRLAPSARLQAAVAANSR